MKFLSIVMGLLLVFCLVVPAVASDCDDNLYDCPVYSAPYEDSADTDWIPTYLTDLVIDEEFVPAGIVLQGN